MEPPQENILTAIAENTRIYEQGVTPQDEVLLWPGSFISWVTFTSRSTPYNCSRGNTPRGDRGGGDFCIRVAQDRAPLSLAITSRITRIFGTGRSNIF
jgi:hypothetical protein